jgi:hypothetical protein
MKKHICIVLAISVLASNAVRSQEGTVLDNVISHQRTSLAENTQGKGFGPQSPRDIDNKAGRNARIFAAAPPSNEMNLTQYAGNGDGHGYQSGYKYSGTLSAQETNPVNGNVCPSDHGGLIPGDTIEVHYVHTTAQVVPGPTLGACLSESINNPQLRVETQVYVLVNNNGANFSELSRHGIQNGVHQALNIPDNTGTPVEYAGSTTGPGYNENGSPLQVTWSVRPNVAKVNINSVGDWCEGNDFNENHAHGVRNLVTNPDLLSIID